MLNSPAGESAVENAVKRDSSNHPVVRKRCRKFAKNKHDYEMSARRTNTFSLGLENGGLGTKMRRTSEIQQAPSNLENQDMSTITHDRIVPHFFALVMGNRLGN